MCVCVGAPAGGKPILSVFGSLGGLSRKLCADTFWDALGLLFECLGHFSQLLTLFSKLRGRFGCLGVNMFL